MLSRPLGSLIGARMEHLLKEYLKTMEKDDEKWRKLAKGAHKKRWEV